MTAFGAEVIKALAASGFAILMGFSVRKRLSSASSVLVAGTAALVAFIGLSLPESMAEFTLRSRRTGIENELRDFRREHAGCLQPGLPCTERELAPIRSRGCTALHGVLDSSWSYPCELPPEVIALTREGGLALAVYGREGEPDVWLVRKDALLVVGKLHTLAPTP